MARFIVAGALLAAAPQSAVPRHVIQELADDIVLSTLAFMVLAFVLSLCSEADAFVAVSFVQFPIASQLAFLVFGPVVDVKLIFLYAARFRLRVVGAIAVLAFTLVGAGALLFQVAFG